MVSKRVDLLLLNSEETVTVQGDPHGDELGIVDNGGVAVKRGRIVQVSSSQLLERKFRARRVLDASGQTIFPGFVDPHTHIVFEGSREEEFQDRLRGVSYLDSLRKGRGILETVTRTRISPVRDLLETARRRLDTALLSGTTAMEVKSGYGLRQIDEMKILQVISRLSATHPIRIVPTFLGAHAIPPEHTSAREYSKMVIEMLPDVKRRGLARFCDVFCEHGAFDSRESLKILRAARYQGMGTKIHADEFSDSGGGRVANLVRAVSADHLVHTPRKELERMVETGVTPVLLPGSSESLLMDRHADAKEMLSLGLNVALGTDFSPANWILGQLTIGAIAARLLRLRASEIIKGITRNAAKALGLAGKIGALVPGNVADLVTLKVPNHKWVGYTYGENAVDKVLIRGSVVVDGGKRIR